jgi:GDP-mannose 6-dehydrogenase
MRISVFGLGYVGIVSAACFAGRGHEVVGVDVSEEKVEQVRSGRTTVHEDQIGDLVAAAVEAGRLTATTSAAEALQGCDLAMVCVGTPSAANGSLSTQYLERAAADIGANLPSDRRLVVVFRSTMLPGTCEERLIPALEAASGAALGERFGVSVNPEFLREGTSVKDFNEPPKTVIGQSDEQTGDVVASLYEGLPGPVWRVPIRVAEMAKYVDNCFHALKVGFSNEIGAICKASGCDSGDVMDIFMSDTKLNISTAYLRPGFAFGGSCLPKDLRALTHHAKTHDVAIPILDNVIRSNEEHLKRAYDIVLESGHRRVGLFGLSFKAGTDDLRESPLVELAERLLGRGFDLRIYDPQVVTSRLMGANRAYVDARIPHLSSLLSSSVDEVVGHSEVCVVGSGAEEVGEALAAADDRLVLDLVRFPGSERLLGSPRYVGLAW